MRIRPAKKGHKHKREGEMGEVSEHALTGFVFETKAKTLVRKSFSVYYMYVGLIHMTNQHNLSMNEIDSTFFSCSMVMICGCYVDMLLLLLRYIIISLDR